jgi:hypothetical protein
MCFFHPKPKPVPNNRKKWYDVVELQLNVTFKHTSHMLIIFGYSAWQKMRQYSSATEVDLGIRLPGRAVIFSLCREV